MPRLMEVLEFVDDTGQVMVKRLPEGHDLQIKWGAQLTVREGQVAVFLADGKTHDTYGPGRYTLKTANIPVLYKALSLLYGPDSPFRAECVFVSLKLFSNLKWGTLKPVTYRDPDFDALDIQGYGMFSIRVKRPEVFVQTVVGTEGLFEATEVEGYLRGLILQRFLDALGERKTPYLDLAAQYDELASEVQLRLAADFEAKGLELVELRLLSIGLTPEYQALVLERSRMKTLRRAELDSVEDVDKYTRLAAADALKKAAGNPGAAGQGMGLGVGLGMGMLMPGMVREALGAAAPTAPASQACPACRGAAPAGAKFCPACGTRLGPALCAGCHTPLSPGAKFCPECGAKA